MKKIIIFTIIIIIGILITLLFLIKNNKDAGKDILKEFGTLSGIDYKLNYDYQVDDFDLSKRGYYIKPNSPYFYIITLGMRPTGGYEISIVNIKIDNNLNVEVTVKEEEPCSECIVTQALTYPTTCLSLSKPVNSIIIKDTKGNPFEKLD